MCKIKSTEDLTNFFCKVCAHIKEHEQSVDINVVVQEQLEKLNARVDKLESKFQKSGLFFNEGAIIKDGYGRYQKIRGQND